MQEEEADREGKLALRGENQWNNSSNGAREKSKKTQSKKNVNHTKKREPSAVKVAKPPNQRNRRVGWKRCKKRKTASDEGELNKKETRRKSQGSSWCKNKGSAN